MSNSAWSDLNSKCNMPKFHVMRGEDGCKCQKMICVTPKQFEMEGSGFKNTMKKFFKGSGKAWTSFLK